MPGPKPFTVELKEQLLEYLLEQAENWDGDSPDIRIFWHTIERDFTDARGTTWYLKDFEAKMEREEDIWEDEVKNTDPDKKRRRGHEEGSNYDKLMLKWCTLWNVLLKKHWQYMVDIGEATIETVPAEFVKGIKVPEPRYEYDGAKLERVVHAAMERANAVGKHDLAAAVEQVYRDALVDTKLRVLLEAILTQKADRRQNEEFQGYVKVAKTKIRELKEEKLKAAAVELAATGTAAPPGIHTPVVTAPGPTAAQVPAALPPAAPAVDPVTVTPANVVAASAVTPVAAIPIQAAAPVVDNAAKIAPAPAVASAASSAMAPPAQPSTASAASPANKTSKGKALAKATPQVSQKESPSGKGKAKGSKDVATTEQTTSPESARHRRGKESSSQVPTTTATAQTDPLAQDQDAAVANPRITAILGDLQFTKTAQQILKAAPTIDDSRLEALKSTLTNHPETKTDFEALAARLEKETSVGADSQASVGASRPVRSTAGKRRRTSGSASSMAEAEEDDLIQAQRAAKRRRGEAGKDDGGDYHPIKAVRDKSRKKKKTSGARPSNSASVETSMSRGSSSLSDLSDQMDIESTKSAYVDEIVRRRNDEQARNDIVARYGPVSPTVDGDADEEWASMASPTLGAAQFDDEQVQMDDGLILDDARVPSPPPEPANNALLLISGAAAQAVARDPGIGRLEAKLDTLITSRAVHGQTANELHASNSETLKEIRTALDGSDMQTTRPEFVRLVVKLTQNAAEAAILSAEAAKKAGEMARDVSLMLQQMGHGAGAGEHPATPISEN